MEIYRKEDVIIITCEFVEPMWLINYGNFSIYRRGFVAMNHSEFIWSENLHPRKLPAINYSANAYSNRATKL